MVEVDVIAEHVIIPSMTFTFRFIDIFHSNSQKYKTISLEKNAQRKKILKPEYTSSLCQFQAHKPLDTAKNQQLIVVVHGSSTKQRSELDNMRLSCRAVISVTEKSNKYLCNFQLEDTSLQAAHKNPRFIRAQNSSCLCLPIFTYVIYFPHFYVISHILKPFPTYLSHCHFSYTEAVSNISKSFPTYLSHFTHI